MDLKVSPVTFGNSAKYASKIKGHQRHLPKSNLLDKVYDIASPAGWLLMLSFLIGSIAYYGIKDINANRAKAKNPVEILIDSNSQDTFTITQE